jgi:hypothetical protein
MKNAVFCYFNFTTENFTSSKVGNGTSLTSSVNGCCSLQRWFQITLSYHTHFEKFLPSVQNISFSRA